MVRQSQFSCEAIEKPGEDRAEIDRKRSSPRIRQRHRRSAHSPSLKSAAEHLLFRPELFGKFVGNYMVTSVNHDARAGACRRSSNELSKMQGKSDCLDSFFATGWLRCLIGQTAISPLSSCLSTLSLVAFELRNRINLPGSIAITPIGLLWIAVGGGNCALCISAGDGPKR
jgi:hypothetical protein